MIMGQMTCFGCLVITPKRQLTSPKALFAGYDAGYGVCVRNYVTNQQLLVDRTCDRILQLMKLKVTGYSGTAKGKANEDLGAR